MKNIRFNNINWKVCNKELAKLQQKLVVAFINKEFKKVKSLQETIVSSFWARALAVRKITTNRGKNTSGVDKELWATEKSKSEAIENLKKRPYKAKPLRRIYILKPNGKHRPLSIPTMYDRAMQALYLYTLDPIAEVLSDERSYGFRKYKGCKDALSYCHNLLNGKFRAKYVLEADIKGCFDNICHDWILSNIPMNKKILKEFLKAGFIEKSQFYKINEGIPQGGVISPTIANMVLSGLEKQIKDIFKNYSHYKYGNPKVNFVRYADDFIVTASKPELFTEKIIPTINKFLKERGLTLNNKKTKITHLTDSFDFLGVTFQTFQDEGKKSGQITLGYPSKKSVLSLKEKIRKVIKSLKKGTANAIISQLNPILRGWANYFQGECSKSTYTRIDHYLFQILWNWAKKKHPRLRKQKIKDYYFKNIKGREWIFSAKKKDGELINLITVAKIPIIRHVICLNKNPYLLENEQYYKNRISKVFKDNYGQVIAKLLTKQEGICKVCDLAINLEDEFDLHHIKPKRLGGTNKLENLMILHTTCHKHITFTKDPKQIAKYEELGITKNRKS